MKRTIYIGGHKTSVYLEDAFWQALEEIAEERHETTRLLIFKIDKDRQTKNLSSSIRVFVLNYYRDRAKQL